MNISLIKYVCVYVCECASKLFHPGKITNVQNTAVASSYYSVA